VAERFFTLSWGVGGINLINQWGSLVLHWVDPNPLPGYSLTMGGEVEYEYWAFDRYAGETVRVTTASPTSSQDITLSKYTTFWMAVTHHQYLIFEVQACAEAHILLTNVPGVISPHSFEVRLGENGNTQSGVYSQEGKEYCYTSSGVPLSCNDFVHLWISWADGYIRVGGGRLPGSQVFLTCEVDVYDISALSFASDKNNDATWVFEQTIGK
jgi:predicted DNA-binding protein with PD1-like motif